MTRLRWVTICTSPVRCYIVPYQRWHWTATVMVTITVTVTAITSADRAATEFEGFFEISENSSVTLPSALVQVQTLLPLLKQLRA